VTGIGDKRIVTWAQATVALVTIVGAIGGYVLGLSNRLAVIESKVDTHVSMPAHALDQIRSEDVRERLARIEEQLRALRQQLKEKSD